MANATIVNAWKDDTTAYLAVSVTESDGNKEYIGSVPLTELVGLNAAQTKAKLVATVKAQRDAQYSTAQALAGLSRSVVV